MREAKMPANSTTKRMASTMPTRIFAVQVGAVAKGPNEAHDEPDERDRSDEIHQEELAGRERLADIGLYCNGRGLIGLLLIVLLLGGRIQTCAAAGAEFCGIGIIGAAIRADHTKTPFEHYDFRLHYIIRNHERKEESA